MRSNGYYDEVRIEKAARSADWIKLCYASQAPGAAILQATNIPVPKIWCGAGADSNWNTAANWMPSGVPATTDSVVFNGTTAKPCSLNVATSPGSSCRCITRLRPTRLLKACGRS